MVWRSLSMWLPKQVRYLELQFSFKFLLFLWIFTQYNKVNGNPSAATVTKARCYANCLTKNPAANKTEKPCQTSVCKECLVPCGKYFSDVASCKQSCQNSISCFGSCEFLMQVKNLSSIFTGDGSKPPPPGIPTVSNTSFASITLEWEPVKNITGSPVYIIEVAFSQDLSRYVSEVFISPQATLTLEHLLCTDISSDPFRSDYKPKLYNFKVTALTENSSLSYGQQTTNTALVKPHPVTNVTLDSLVYDAASNLDKVKLTASWIPPKGQNHLITKFGMLWNLDRTCKDFFSRRAKETPGPDLNISTYISQNLMKCNHTIRIYSLIGCSPSDPATLTYTYPGCQYITNFPKDECYKFDPPKAPIEDRVVRNIRTAGPLKAQADYTFNVAVVWDPPIYPYKDVQRYMVWKHRNDSNQKTGFKYFGFERVTTASLFLSILLPGTIYKIEIQPMFFDNKPWAERRSVNITTPGVVQDEIKVHLKAGQFSPSPDGGSFVANVSWDKPTFNYSTLSEYQFSYQVEGKRNTMNTTKKTYFTISGILHGERVDYWVTPRYKDNWIIGKEEPGHAKAPVPLVEDIKVKNMLVGDFVPEQGMSTFSVNFSWTGPVFSVTFRSFVFTYELTGYNANKTIGNGNVTNPEFVLSGIRPKEFVTFKVTPIYNNIHITGQEVEARATAPKPDPNTVKVQNLSKTMLNTSKPDQKQYNFLVTWQRPLFRESSVRKYAVTYSRSGIPHRAEQWEFKTVDTSFPVSDLIPGDTVEAEVTPEFVASVLTGVPEKINIEPLKPSDQELQIQKLRNEPFFEDEETNTFSVKFTWEKPSFEHSQGHSYTVSYEFYGGYPREQRQCLPLARDHSGCSKTGINQTSLLIAGIFPEEEISVKVTPIYNNIHITGQEVEARATAPKPNEELVKVIDLRRSELVPGPNNTFGTTVRWEKPLFTHSGVKHYVYKVLDSSGIRRRKRDNNLNTALQTTNTNVTIRGLNRDASLEFQVTPVFVVPVVTGINEEVDLTWKVENDKEALALTPAEIGGLIVGVILAALIVICLIVYCYRERKKQMNKRGLVSGSNALMIDDWEVDGELVSLEEELGEGAFGKVYKGTLKETSTLSRKLSVRPPTNALRKTTIKQSTGFTVAVKMLHGMADSDQRREFLQEIQLMKAVGSHKNIVNMIGCCTVEEPMFLLVEYVPYGDLLHYLRKCRGKVKEYLGDEYRGPYRSTYCETYVIDKKPGQLSIQATGSDRIYVNTPDASKGESGNIQILSFTQSLRTEDESGRENKEVTKDEANDEDEEGEEGLTPGDLLAFAWQISEGMEYLARKGFVHRDLAARNILVGEHKIAKVADFGLTRHVYEEKVYHAKRNRKLPLKWMSIEAIFEQTFTTQSDVWAFGVVLWELVTLGGTPYPTINNRELLHLLKSGYRMEKPEICNDEIYGMMTMCWMESPYDRPNFTLIREKLEEMMQKDNPYLDFSALDETRDYYNVPSFNSVMDETDDKLLDKEEDELLKEPNDDIRAEERTRKEDCSNRNEYATVPEAFKSLGKRGDSFDSGFGLNNNNKVGGKNVSDLKDITVDFDAIEMSLYRPGNREIVL